MDTHHITLQSGLVGCVPRECSFGTSVSSFWKTCHEFNLSLVAHGHLYRDNLSIVVFVWACNNHILGNLNLSFDQSSWQLQKQSLSRCWHNFGVGGGKSGFTNYTWALYRQTSWQLKVVSLKVSTEGGKNRRRNISLALNTSLPKQTDTMLIVGVETNFRIFQEFYSPYNYTELVYTCTHKQAHVFYPVLQTKTLANCNCPAGCCCYMC